jgi:aerobic carbon-monoxide dehydrogenase medium subunit
VRTGPAKINGGNDMKPFQYLDPANTSEAILLLAKCKEEAKVIAGGTDLVVQMRKRAVKPQYIVDINGIPGLDYIRYDAKEGLTIGALTTIRALEKSPELWQWYPLISQAASKLGSVAIRNVATVGGNLCNAMPIADTAQALLALSAKAKIVGPEGEKVIPLEDFFIGLGKNSLRTGELLVEIQVPVPLPNTRGLYLKHLTRGSIDLAIVNVAVVITLVPEDKVCKDIKIVLGSVASTPIRARKAEDIMRGRRVDEALINRTAQAASEEAHPRPGSIRASVEYKKEMVKLFTRQLIKEVVFQYN